VIRVGVVVALTAEQRTLSNRRIELGQSQNINETTQVFVSGMGSENAEKAATQLVQQGCRALLSWGCAAALDVKLKPGDLICPAQVISVGGGRMGTNSSWHESIVDKLGSVRNVHTGVLIESAGIVESAAAKAELHATTGAIAVDMESAAVLRVAVKHQVPVLVIRAVADPASMNLPAAVNAATQADGGVNMPLLLVNTIRNPSVIASLVRLGIHFQSAKTTLKQVASRLDFDFSPASSTA